jgi:electron transfer flavoprotein beta subunit
MRSILIPIKRVVDSSIKISCSDGKISQLDNLKMSINPFCEIALEEGIRMKEKKWIDQVIAVSVGTEKCQDVLRHAFALGADRSILVKQSSDMSPLQIAKILARLIQKETPEIVLLGKQSIDGDNNQTGQILAGILDWPQATFASKIDQLENSTYEVSREVDEGVEVVRLTSPCVITADLRLNQPRFASLPNLMKAKKKTIEVIEDTEPVENHWEILSIEEPPKRKPGKIVKSVDELIDKLRNEAKIL